MAQEFVTYQKGYTVSVNIKGGGDEHTVSAALEALIERRHTVSVVVYGPEVSERRLTGSITVTERLPDSFYGFSEESSGSISIENLDGALDFLLDEDNRGEIIRIRRYDQENQEITNIFTGTIDSIQVSDEVVFKMSSHRLDAFDVEYPRNRVYTVSDDYHPQPQDVNVTSVFPEATDINEPIPIVFGRVRHLPLTLVKSDTTAKRHEYLVCEGGNVNVERVFRSGRPTHTETALVSSITVPGNTLVLAETALGSPAFYKDLYIRIIEGYGEGEANTKLITEYDPVTRTVTVDSNWVAGDDGSYPAAGSTYEITEYKTLRDTADYRRRTAISFRYAQKQDGQLQPLSATVARFENVRRNLCCRTEEFDHAGGAAGTVTGWAAVGGTIVTPNVVYGPDGDLTADGVYFPNSAAELSETVEFGGTPSGAYTFSVYLRVEPKNSGRQARLLIRGMTSTTNLVNLTASWVRYSVTKSTFHRDYEDLVIENPDSEPLTVYVWGAQYEQGGTPTAYFPVHGAGQGFRWSFPDAIRELLIDPVFGLKVPINQASFDQANTDLEGLFLKCQGSIPSLRGKAGTGKQILDDLLRVRGMRLTNIDGLWNLTVDKAQSTIGTLGAAGTAEDNIIEIGALQQKPVDQIVRTIVLRYNLDRKEDESLETVFKGEVSASSNPTGVEEIIESQFIRDFGTADRTVQYLAGKHIALSTEREVTIGQAGRVIAVGNVVTLNIPRRMTENRLRYSEQLNESSAWKNQGSAPHPTVTLVDGRNHYEKGQRLNQIAFPAGSVARTDDVLQDVDVGGAANTKAFFTCWVRAVDSPITNGRLQFRLANEGAAPYETEILEPHIGTAWKQVKLSKRFSNAVGGNNIRIQLMRNSSNPLDAFTVQVAGCQLALEHDYQYAKTTATAKPVQELWQVTEVQRTGIDKVKLKLIPYIPNTVFAYTESNPPPSAGDTSSEDATLIPPDPPGNILMPPPPPAIGSPPSSTAAAGAAVLPDGSTDSYAAFSMTAPSSNVKRIDLQRRVVGEAEYETISSIDIDDDNLSKGVVLVGHGFTPGLQYDIRAVSVNARNLWTASEAQQFVAYGDRKAPLVIIAGPPADVPNSDRLTVATGTGKMLEVDLKLSGSSIPADLGTVKLYRATVNTFPGESGLIEQRKALRFHDASVAIGLQYYYWARLLDLTGNESGVIGNGNSEQADSSANYPRGATTGTAVTGVQTAEIEDAAITSAKIGTAAIQTAHIGAAQVTNAEIAGLSADKITTGTLTVGTPGGADAIKVYRASGSEIAFWETVGGNRRRAYFNITSAGGLTLAAASGEEIDLFIGGSTGPESVSSFQEGSFYCQHSLVLAIGDTVDPLRPQSLILRAGTTGQRGFALVPDRSGIGLLNGSYENLTSPGTLAPRRIPIRNAAGTLLGYIPLYV